MRYVTSPQIEAVLALASARMGRGQGATLFLEGPPGSGKTELAKEFRRRIGGELLYYSCAEDRERDLLYQVDVDGVLRRERGWVPGPAWQAFNLSHQQPVVLLVDEIDKASKAFDAFLLRLLEEWSFAAPGGETVTANRRNVAVVLTSNGRRPLRPELLRRCQRQHLPLPAGSRHREIVDAAARQAGAALPPRLVDLLCRIGEALPERPSPKELAQLGLDAVELARASVHDPQVWRAVAASWLVRDHSQDADPAVAIDRAMHGQRWWQALRTEAAR